MLQAADGKISCKPLREEGGVQTSGNQADEGRRVCTHQGQGDGQCVGQGRGCARDECGKGGKGWKRADMSVLRVEGGYAHFNTTSISQWGDYACMKMKGL